MCKFFNKFTCCETRVPSLAKLRQKWFFHVHVLSDEVMGLSRNFHLLFLANALSLLGTAMMPVALSFAVLGEGHSASILGVVLAAQTVPTVIFQLVGGVMGDRWPRWRVMIAADLLRAVSQTVLAISLISDTSSTAMLVSMAALLGIGNAFFNPASAAFVVEIINKEQLERANGALRLVNALTMVIGPFLGGLIVINMGAGWAIGVDAGTYAASALCLAFISIKKRERNIEKSCSVLHDLREGVNAFTERRWLFGLVCQIGLLNMLVSAPFLVIAPALLAQLPDGAQAWGSILSAIGIGSVLGAFGIMWRKPQRPLIAIEWATGLLAGPMFLLAMQAPLPLMLGSSMLYGAGIVIINILLITVIQREIPSGLLSRVMSIVQLVVIVFTSLGYLLTGPMASLLGANVVLLCGSFTIVISLIMTLMLGDIRQYGKQS